MAKNLFLGIMKASNKVEKNIAKYKKNNYLENNRNKALEALSKAQEYKKKLEAQGYQFRDDYLTDEDENLINKRGITDKSLKRLLEKYSKSRVEGHAFVTAGDLKFYKGSKNPKYQIIREVMRQNEALEYIRKTYLDENGEQKIDEKGNKIKLPGGKRNQNAVLRAMLDFADMGGDEGHFVGGRSYSVEDLIRTDLLKELHWDMEEVGNVISKMSAKKAKDLWLNMSARKSDVVAVSETSVKKYNDAWHKKAFLTQTQNYIKDEKLAEKLYRALDETALWDVLARYSPNASNARGLKFDEIVGIISNDPDFNKYIADLNILLKQDSTDVHDIENFLIEKKAAKSKDDFNKQRVKQAVEGGILDAEPLQNVW